MKFAIRDDDVSFWTNPFDLETIYKKVWDSGFKVSFGVIPFAVESFHLGDINKFFQTEISKPIGENKELIDFLRDRIKEKKVSIMLHGYSHQYKVSKGKNNVLFLATKENLEILRNETNSLYWYGEYTWKSYEQLKKETKEGKIYLEDILHTKIKVFVPPSNDISIDGIKAVVENKLNISGQIYLERFNRPINFWSIRNWLIKFWWKLIYGNIYPYVMNYKTHRELCTYGLVPGVSLEQLKEQFKFCLKFKAPFVLATHYWELLKNRNLIDIYNNFLKFISGQKIDKCFVEDCYD